MKTKLWIATYVDYGENCDGKPRVLEVCKSKDEAIAAVRLDIENWVDERAGRNINVDFNKMSAYFCDDRNTGCEWNIVDKDFDEDEQTNVDDGQLEFDFTEV